MNLGTIMLKKELYWNGKIESTLKYRGGTGICTPGHLRSLDSSFGHRDNFEAELETLGDSQRLLVFDFVATSGLDSARRISLILA